MATDNGVEYGVPTVITDEEEIKRVKALLDTPAPEELSRQGGLPSDSEEIYAQSDKSVGPAERWRLESEKKTGVQTTIPGAIGRMAGDVLFLGDARKVEQRNALSDLLQGEWTGADWAKAGPTPMGSPGGLPVNPPKAKFSFKTATPEQILGMAEYAGLDRQKVSDLANQRVAYHKAKGENVDTNTVMQDVVQTLAEDEMANRVHVSARASRALPGGGAGNEPGYGFSVLGGGVPNVAYAGQYTLGSAIAGPTGLGLVLPLLASYDRRFEENRSSEYRITPEGGVRQSKAGLSAEDAVLPSAIGAAGEVAVESVGGEAVGFLGKKILGPVVRKLGADRLIKNSPSARAFAKSFDDIAKITKTQSYPGEIAEEWMQEMFDAGFATTPQYRDEGGLADRLGQANKNFGGNFNEIALSMLLMQGGQAAIAAAKGGGEVSVEKRGEAEAAARLKAAGVGEATVKNLLADRDARSVIDYISSMTPEQSQEAAKRMSARSVAAAEEVKKTTEWMNALGDKGVESRFSPPTPAELVPGEDGTATYIDTGTDTEISFDSVAGEVGVLNRRTGRTAFVRDGKTQGERMERAFLIADAMDKEAQGRDIVNEKKREMLANVLRAKGVEGEYVIVDSPAQLARQPLSEKAKKAVEAKVAEGAIPQAFVDPGDTADAKPKTYFVLDNIRLGEGPDAFRQTTKNIVDAATHEPVHVAALSAKSAGAFGDIYAKATPELRREIARYGIARELGQDAADAEFAAMAPSSEDTVDAEQERENLRRRWFEEGVAYLSEGSITQQATGAQKLRRKLHDLFGANTSNVADLRVLVERAMERSRGAVRVSGGKAVAPEPRVIAGQTDGQVSGAAPTVPAVSDNASEQTGAMPIAPGADGAGAAGEIDRPTQATPSETLIPSAAEAPPNAGFTHAAVAREYFFDSGAGAMQSTGYLFNAFAGAFPRAQKQLRSVMDKHRKVIGDTQDDIRALVNTQEWPAIVADVASAIEKAYGANGAEARSIAVRMLGNPTGLTVNQGKRLNVQLDELEGKGTSAAPLTEEQAIAAMPEPQAEPPPVEEVVSEAPKEPFVTKSDTKQVDVVKSEASNAVLKDVPAPAQSTEKAAPVAEKAPDGNKLTTKKTVYGDMTTGPLVSLSSLKPGDHFIAEDEPSGYYGQEVTRVLGFEGDGRIVGQRSYGGQLAFAPDKRGYKVEITDNPAKSSGLERSYPDFETFFDKIGFQGADPFAKEKPDSIPAFKDTPPNSVIVTVGKGNYGNAAPMYAVVPTGEVYKWESGFQHGGLTPWRFEGWSKWHKGERPGAQIETEDTTPPPPSPRPKPSSKKESRPQQVSRIKKAFAAREPVPAADIDRLGLKIPDTYVLKGDVYAHTPTEIAAPALDRKGRTPEQVARLKKMAAVVREASFKEGGALPKPAALKSPAPQEPLSSPAREPETQTRKLDTAASDVSGREAISDKTAPSARSARAVENKMNDVRNLAALAKKRGKATDDKSVVDAVASLDETLYRRYAHDAETLQSLRDRYAAEVWAATDGRVSVSYPSVGGELDKATQRQAVENGLGVVTEARSGVIRDGRGDVVRKATVATGSPRAAVNETLAAEASENVPQTPVRTPVDAGVMTQAEYGAAQRTPEWGLVQSRADAVADAATLAPGEDRAIRIRDAVFGLDEAIADAYAGDADMAAKARAYAETEYAPLAADAIRFAWPKIGDAFDGKTMKTNGAAEGTVSSVRSANVATASGATLQRAEVELTPGKPSGKEIGFRVTQEEADAVQEGLAEHGTDSVRFRVVADDNTVKRLDADRKITAFAAMQLVDGNLVSPMAGKVEGKWTNPVAVGAWYKADERPDLAFLKKNKKGKAGSSWFFKLNKGNGSAVDARYNPYFHSSLSPLNDQFTSASNRENLVTVEVEIPAGDIGSGYKAEKAKDAVGEHTWKSGPVARMLPESKMRKVFLSQYRKIVRVVPDAEVAQKIAELLKNENIDVPRHVVTPSLAEELVKAGVSVVDAKKQKRKEKEIGFRVTPQQDAEYMQAVNAGDMTTAQRLVDEAAKEAGYWLRRDFGRTWAFRGIGITPREMESPIELDRSDEEKMELWSENQPMSRFGYNGAQESLYSQSENTTVFQSDKHGLESLRYVATINGEGVGYIVVNRRTESQKERYGGEAHGFPKIGLMYVKPQYRGQGVSVRLMASALENLGELNADISNSTSAIAAYKKLSGKGMVKLADPVTRDDAGNVIPLSARFNTASNDIRFRVGRERDNETLKDILSDAEEAKKEAELDGNEFDADSFVFSVTDYRLEAAFPVIWSDFYGNPATTTATVFHRTSEENAESIARDGLLGADKSRGIGNRWVGDAIFASAEDDPTMTYGDVLVEINLGAARTLSSVETDLEPSIANSIRRSTLAHLLGVEDRGQFEVSSSYGENPNTLVIKGNIDPRAIRVSDKGGNVLHTGTLFKNQTPGKPSGKEIGFRVDRGQTETPEFKAWFGDSKVVDADGKPLVVYRGDRVNKSVFTGREDPSNYIQGNVFFSSNPSVAAGYSAGRGRYFKGYARADALQEDEGMYRTYLSLRKPLVVDARSESWDSIPFEDGQTQIDDLALKAQQRGYDGLIVRNVYDQYGLSDQYVAFSPTQIKSATANVGTFDPTNPDIRFRIDRGQTETPAFRAWFQDSKVVDADGKPLVVYHGTRADFGVFERTGGEFGGGSYFSEDTNYANYFATSNLVGEGGNTGANIMPVYLSIKNPYTFRMWDPGKTNKHRLLPTRTRLIKMGYDGVIGYTMGDQKEYIAFFPEQIKSATGNIGTFDPTNPDIRFRTDRGPVTDAQFSAARTSFRKLSGLMDADPTAFRRPQGAAPLPIERPLILDKADLERIAKVVTGAPLPTPASVSQAGEMAEAKATYKEYEVRSAIDRIVRERRPVENNDTVAKIRLFLTGRLHDAVQADADMDRAVKSGDWSRQQIILDTREALVRDLDQATAALDLVGSERGRQLAFLKTGLDKSLSVIYRLSKIRKATGRSVSVEEYDKIVAQVAADAKTMKKLYESHEKVRLEEASKRDAAVAAERAKSERAVLEAFRRGAAAERDLFDKLLARKAASGVRQIASFSLEDENADTIPFRVSEGGKASPYPGPLRDAARRLFAQTKADGLGFHAFAERVFEWGDANGVSDVTVNAYLVGLAEKMGIPKLAAPVEKYVPPAAKAPGAAKGNTEKLRKAEVRRAVRQAVAEDMTAPGDRIAARAAEILRGSGNDAEASDFGYLSPDDVMGIVTGYPAELEADTRDELQRRYDMVRRQMLALQRIDELKAGGYPTPMTRGNDAPDVSLRQLAREVRDLMNAHVFPEGTDDPRMVNAAKALSNRLEYAIEEMRKALATGEPINEKAPRAVKETPEIKTLRDTLKALRAAYEAMPSVAEIAEARDTERARRAANKRYHFWDRRLSDAKEGLFPPTFKGTSADERDAETAAYKAKAEEARREYWRIKKASPQEKIAVLTERVTKAEDRLAELEARLAATPVASPFAPKAEEAPAATPEEAALRERLAAVRLAAANVRKSILAKWQDENAEEIARVREADRFQFLVAKAAAIEKKIKAGDFAKPARRPRVWSPRVAIEEDKVRAGLRVINERIEWEANAAAGWTGKAKNANVWTGNVYKFFKASWDVSNVGVQSARLFSSDLPYGVRLIGGTLANAGSDESQAEFMADMHNDPDYQDAYEAGLALDQQYDDVFGSGMGETFFRDLALKYGESGSLLGNIGASVANVGLASQRAFDMYGRMMRFHVYKSIVNDPAHANLTKAERAAVANMINIMGGVGNTRVYPHDAASLLSNLMWSSRLFTAQWQTLAGGGGLLWNAGTGVEGSKKALGREWWQTAAPGAAKLYARSLAGNFAVAWLFGGIGMLLGDRQPWEDEETMFWKAWQFMFGRRMIGSKSIDVSGGLTSYVALARRVIDGSHVSMSGRTVPDNDWRAWQAAISNFSRGRLRPDISFAINMIFGEDVTGEPFGPRGGWEGVGNMVAEGALPITPSQMMDTVYDMWKTHGIVGFAAGLVPALASDLFGFSKSDAPRDPAYEINRHKSHMGQVRKAYEAAKETGRTEEYERLANLYSFDIMVSGNVASLEKAAKSAEKEAGRKGVPASYAKDAEKARLEYMAIARDLLRQGK